MKSIRISSFDDYLAHVNKTIESGQEIILYRGQADDDALLPSIARNNAVKNILDLEKDMLEELKRRAKIYVVKNLGDNLWEWLVYAQHYGMKTRLLDWSSNPLVGLWFACKDEYKLKQDSYVFILEADKSFVVTNRLEGSPFEQDRTRILKPSLNNERIMAQSGWFTIHKIWRGSFLRLDKVSDMKNKISKVIIPSEQKIQILDRLGRFGINYQTIFPEVEGVCKHLNWKYVTRNNYNS